MSPSDIDNLKELLTDKDFQVLQDVEKYRLLTTRQVQRLHFDHAHPTAVAAARACNRVLSRLRAANVLRPLQRRIGGARAGSAGFVWYVGPAGERLLRRLSPIGRSARSNYREPSRHFVEHTLAIAEAATQLTEAARRGQIELIEVQTEPSNWQASLSNHGTPRVLKPDLRAVTAWGEYEHHWFIEIDMATEHLPVIVRQCQAYQAFRATGRYEATHGLFPAVLWVVPTGARAKAIQAAVAATPGLEPALFKTCATEAFLAVIRSAGEDPS